MDLIAHLKELGLPALKIAHVSPHEGCQWSHGYRHYAWFVTEDGREVMVVWERELTEAERELMPEVVSH